MDAMILAAGSGTRLKPLTDTTPKALIEVGGVTMLERTVRRLAEAGADRIVVNVHHHAEQIERFVLEKLKVDAAVLLSYEPDRPLDTGGGLLHAASMFRQDAPLFVHNVDVITDMDLAAMYRSHEESHALVTLAVNRRETPRFLLFDHKGLYGWANTDTGEMHSARDPEGSTRRIGFAGIHVISPELFYFIEESGVFSIMNLYMRLAGVGHAILPYDMSGAEWWEVGSVERLEAARRELVGDSPPTPRGL